MPEPLTYKTAGVDVAAGDRASHRALEHARRTFGFREGRQGQAVTLDGVFTGLIDAGPFYLVMNSDGVGSKAVVAAAMGRYDTLGHDLLAMVADDAACAGAEPVALVNTLDVEHVDEAVVGDLMRGLEDACRAASVSVVGGEIAEMPDQIRGISWSAALVGLLRKERVLGPHRVQENDGVIGLLTDNFRANGFTLLRRILERAHGPDWVRAPYDGARAWGEVALAPSRVFTPFLNHLTGGFSREPAAPISALAHVTGGGLESNTRRVLPAGLRIAWGSLPEIPEVMRHAADLGGVDVEETRHAWNCGIGMVVLTPSPQAVLALAASMQVPARELGKVVRS
ncbi:MAG: hypothetical protein FJX76_04665 [Armatimonadetes bacterium]|nr:hypothetical protein [Armatimonadota bacterium]